MSSFEDIETQNARRPLPGRAHLHGRGRWRFSGLRDELLAGRAAEVEFCGDMREWLTMTDGERWEALWSLVHARREAAMVEGPAPLRLPRTALGLCHAGPIAPAPPEPYGLTRFGASKPTVDGEWILYLPGGRKARMSSAPRSDT